MTTYTTPVGPGETLNVSMQQLTTQGEAVGSELAVVECNANLSSGDPNACNQNPEDIGRPGGPALAVEKGTNLLLAGNFNIPYPFRVSANNPVGDGLCPPIPATTCYLVVADINTHTVVGEESFTTG